MSVILTNGQSFDQIAATYTLAPEYGIAIQNYNNMESQTITGKRFRIEIPDTWMKPEYSGKQIDLAASGGGLVNGPGGIIPGIPNWALLAGAGALLLFMN